MRIAGAVLLMASAYFYGMYSVSRLNDKMRIYDELYASMKYCTEQVRRRVPTDIILQRAFSLYPRVFSEVGCLSEEAKNGVGREFYSVLGTQAAEEQTQQLEFLCERMRDAAEAQKKKSERDRGVCRLLPLFFAALAVIIFI